VGSEAAPFITLQGRWLGVARAVWIGLAVFTLGVYVAGASTLYERLETVCAGEDCAQWRLSPEAAGALREVGISLEFYAAAGIALSALSALVFFAVAALLFWRRSNEWMALLLSLYLLLNGPGGNFLTELNQVQPIWSPLITSLGYLSTALFIPLFYLFPDGRFVPSWTRVLAAVWVALQFPYYFFPNSLYGPSNWAVWLSGAVFVGYLLSIVFAQVYRYRRVSGPVERQQTRWVVFGLAVVISGSLPLALVAEGALLPAPFQAFAGILVDPLFVLLPLCVGIAVLRYRLWDIDLVINRTLVFGALTACVVGLYVLVVGGLSMVLQTRGNLFVSLLAAGLVAVLFAPLRARLQRAVNHLMYGERDDPYAVLSRLGQRLEATLEPGAVLPAVVETIAGALRLPYAAIELKENGERDGFTVVASHGSPEGSLVRVPLVHQHETVGRLMLTPRAGEEGFSAADRRLLEDLARQAGAAAHAVRLTADLQRARERLVTAREEERRRLRRDLHDGLGPQLSSQTLTIDAVREVMRQDPDAAEALLLDLKAQSRDAVADVRRLVYALRPPALDDLGLIGALRASAAQYASNGLRVSVETPQSDSLPPLPAAVEVAAYRIAQEALTNVARHARANRCTVRLALDEEPGTLRLEVEDDGRGIGEDRGSGVGLQSMRERAAELGGSITVGTPAGGGTVVRARLPLEGR
jgi:signal transduction histidine kinase